MLKNTSSQIMAPSFHLKCCCSLLALLCLAITCCKSDGQDPVDIVDQALACFHDHYVYSSCQESYRLNAEGTIPVPPEAADQYCEGPCLVETKLVLKCIDAILYNFRFYNGASIRDVRYTLDSGCGHSDKRGDFDVAEHLGADGYGDYYGHGNKVAVSINMMVLISCVLLLWG